jgi:hypothetical protein
LVGSKTINNQCFVQHFLNKTTRQPNMKTKCFMLGCWNQTNQPTKNIETYQNQIIEDSNKIQLVLVK